MFGGYWRSSVFPFDCEVEEHKHSTHYCLGNEGETFCPPTALNEQIDVVQAQISHRLQTSATGVYHFVGCVSEGNGSVRK